MRHGKPVLAKTDWITPIEIEGWIDLYNCSEVATDGAPISSLQFVNTSTCIVASTARRALSSVQALGLSVSVTDKVFCEAQLPYPLWRFPRLPTFVWAAFFRLCWFFGYSQGAESILAAKDRARVAAEKLIMLAANGPVLLVGHGIMNRLIAKELVVLGWVSSAKHESKYWSTNVYQLQP